MCNNKVATLNCFLNILEKHAEFNYSAKYSALP